MINLDSITNENNKKQWKMAIYTWSSIQNFNNWCFWIGKNKYITQFNDKIYLYARDFNEPKYKILIKKCKDAGIKHLNDPNAFIEYSNTMDDVYENINDYNPSRKRKLILDYFWWHDCRYYDQ